MNNLQRLYRDTIRQHAAKPVGHRQQIEATHECEEFNPLCGDRIVVQLRIIAGQVEAAAFDGEACAICMASASLLCEHTPGHPAARLEELHDRLTGALSGGVQSGDIEVLKPLLGVQPYPARIRCATLPWSAGIKALSSPKSLKN